MIPQGKNEKIKRKEEKGDGKIEDRTDLVFDLVLLGFLKRDVILGETRLALPVLEQNESDLQFKQIRARVLEIW